jgi:beta-glucosidase
LKAILFKNMKKTVLFFIATSMLMTSCGKKAPKLGVHPIDDVIAAMSLEEKASFVVGTERMKTTPPDRAPGMPVREMFSPELKEKLMQCETQEEAMELMIATSLVEGRVQGAAGQHYALDRLGIEPIVYADGPAGLRIDPTRKDDADEYYCTAFPVGVSLSSSWDVELVNEVTRAMGNEVLEYGADVLLAPGINIHRSPLCGRNFEYYSEDPLLAGKIASAYIKGIQSNGVGVSLKHYAVNNQETCRNGVDARLSERALREIYLKGFEIAVKESQPWTIMSSYNKINGTLASENYHTLTEILRDDWGFEGFVMTDWWAEENGARQIAAGNDLQMPGTLHQYEEIYNGVKDGSLDEKTLDQSIRRIMNIMLKTPTYRHYAYSNKPDLGAHAKVTRQAATDGMVLLKNVQKSLPLDSKARVALFGTASYDLLVGGSGSGNVNRKYKVSLDEGLKNAGVELEDNLTKVYKDYTSAERAKMPTENFWSVPVIPEMPLDKALVKNALSKSTVAILTLSRMAGEGGDRHVVKGDYLLSDVEEQNLKLVCQTAHAMGKKVILVLNLGGIVDLTQFVALPDAILHAWMGGQEMGNSLADVLMGKVNPSGKLPLTWALRYSDYPSAGNFPLSDGDSAYVRYAEDVMVGYRHFNTQGIKVLYPFGYGLSYTTFAYNNLIIDVLGEQIKVSADITNTGKVAGREVVQLYVGKPSVDGLLMPAKELKAFTKTKLLNPGETQTVEMIVPCSELATWMEAENKWNVASGEYTISVAANVEDVRLKGVATL